jgi:hypothetical protein
MLGISCVAAQLAASQEGLSSMNDDDDDDDDIRLGLNSEPYKS